MDYKFKFSIIMAVYNVEAYLEEAVESLVNQTIGFDCVQVILVDDGSPDNSGAICDAIKAKYPSNIVVVHKENGGVSSARNEGLKHIEGKYVNCMDPDDILTKNTLENVYSFFEKNYNATDVVGIPIVMFGDTNGPHYLNDKFARGTRVINLQKEVNYFQLSCSCAFIKNEIAKSIRFDESLTVAEDAQQMIRILINKPFLGVVSGCHYGYRKHAGSALSNGLKKCWYNDYIYSFILPSIEYAKEKYGYVPRFVQNALMSNLQWRLSEKARPACLDENELKQYKDGLALCFKEFDDDIIMKQKHCSSDNRAALIATKYQSKDFITKETNDILLGFDSHNLSRLSNTTFSLDFLEINEDSIILSARKTFFTLYGNVTDGFIKIGDNTVKSTKVEYMDHGVFLGDAITKDAIFEFIIPRELLAKENKISFYVECDGINVENKNINFGTFFPLQKRYKSSYYFENGLLFKLAKSSLVVSKAKNAKKYERKLLKELWKSNKLGERKAVFARILAKIYKLFHRKPIWIISDRVNKSGDNGEAFFRHLKSIKFKGAKYYYAIGKCPSYYSMKKLGNVIDCHSLKYKIMHLACELIISAQADINVYDPFPHYSQPYKDIITRKKFIFLQHGIIKDDLSDWLNKYNKNITGFICSVEKEYESIVNGNYHYDEKNVWLTGLARFDRLYRDEKKYITIMPTWRKYLMSHIDNQTGIWQEKPGFTESNYFTFYNNLINDKRVLDVAVKHGYTICFMPHPNTITKIDLFTKNKNVKFYTVNDEYREVYAQSDLILTDYSSSVFDFVYLRKPIFYTHFDKEEFIKGDHAYIPGYFDYERDGFGEVVYDYESTVKTLIEYMENGCNLKDKYRERIDSFFAFNDKNNCQRTLDKILVLK
ncbi:MAG: CDP-glycerol glycerophosphotransferase family protein [Clostridia bacterium]|nr:CDP-glycerol glycerophosphotransferase family protein [Clostridia bacterium]